MTPDCSRIELGSLSKAQDELKLLYTMGWETANIHLGTKTAARAVASDLRKRPSSWLRKAGEAMTKASVSDWKDWSGK